MSMLRPSSRVTVMARPLVLVGDGLLGPDDARAVSWSCRVDAIDAETPAEVVAWCESVYGVLFSYVWKGLELHGGAIDVVARGGAFEVVVVPVGWVDR